MQTTTTMSWTQTVNAIIRLRARARALCTEARAARSAGNADVVASLVAQVRASLNRSRALAATL